MTRSWTHSLGTRPHLPLADRDPAWPGPGCDRTYLTSTDVDEPALHGPYKGSRKRGHNLYVFSGPPRAGGGWLRP